MLGKFIRWKSGYPEVCFFGSKCPTQPLVGHQHSRGYTVFFSQRSPMRFNIDDDDKASFQLWSVGFSDFWTCSFVWDKFSFWIEGVGFSNFWTRSRFHLGVSDFLIFGHCLVFNWGCRIFWFLDTVLFSIEGVGFSDFWTRSCFQLMVSDFLIFGHGLVFNWGCRVFWTF